LKTIGTRVDPEKYEKLSSTLFRERATFTSWLDEQITEYLKKHGDGNPAYTLDQFQDPNFKACPAFFRDTNVWKNYIQTIIKDKKQYQEFDEQLNMILNLTNKIFRHS
jgi:hypothetical protein